MASYPYTFSALTSVPPAAGEIRSDAADPLDATALYIDASPAGMDALLAVRPGELVRAELVADPELFISWTINGMPMDGTPGGPWGFAYLTLVYQWGSGLFPLGPVNLVLPTPAVPVDPDAPFVLGPADVFATPAELAGYLGGQTGTAGDQRRNLALIAASRWVAYRVGIGVDDALIPPGDITVTPVEARPAWRAATLVAATRFYRSSDAVFGAMGGLGDDAVIVRAAITEAELLLVGQTLSWGIA